ncbi:MAG: T9SS type A sorting domain-containing protein [Bacteroidetes bacterium]|nr:T9SS type A sorting domain-containing protein [Bacteroidota bacterium]
MKITTTRLPIILIVVFFLFNFSKSLAQAGIGLPYGFGVTPTSTNITGATTINLTIRPVAIQDEMDTLINIPAAGTITFGGIVYNQFAISTNGWLALVPSTAGLPASNPFPPNPTNSLSTSALGYPVIAPLWDDMAMASIQYNWTAPVLTVKWTGRWDKTNASLTNAFGVKINGTTGICTFFYNNVAYTPTSPSASIGIAGICTGDFTAVNVTSATAALSDTVIEPNVTIRPNNVNYIFTPYNPHDNCSGTYIAKDLGTIGSSCTLSGNYSTVHATTSGSGMACAAGEVKDVWFSVIKPLGVTNFRVTTAPGSCQPLAGTTVEVRATCAGASLGCSTTGTTYPTFGEVDIARPCAAETLYVRVTGDGDAAGKFRICVMDNGLSTTSGADCGNATVICSLPYSQTGLNTAGFGNEYDSTNAQCHDPFLNGEDYVFTFTPTATTCAQVQISTTGINPGLFIYDGCPNLGTTHCLNSIAGITGIVGINSVTFLAGVTYYIVVDNNPLNATNNIPFDITISSLSTAVAYDPCLTAANLGSVANNTPCTFTTYTTECAQPTTAGTVPVPPCGNFYDGVTGDVWIKFTSTFNGSLLVKTQPSAANPTSDAAMAIYTGASCGALTLFACDDNSAGSSMPLLSIPVANGTTYYIRMWTVNPGNTGNFDLCLSSACSPPNDLPCQAIYIPLGGTAAGFNTCSGATNEPPNSAQCTAGGIVNTVWYKTVVPTSGTLKIRTHPLTLTDTQIQAFTFASGCANSTTTYVNKGCNDDGPDCGSQSNQSYHDYSELTLTGLLTGDTIFIAVDGFNSMTGTFEITAIDGTGGVLTPVYMQDCEYPYEVCGVTNIIVPDPGPLNFGNICDFQPSYDCWANGERNSIWYRVTVNPGTLQFAINSVTDYDFIMWDVTGVSNACAQIQAHTLPSIRCNWVTTTGQTGISNANPNASWEASITNAGTRSYLILIDNWNPPSWITGFTLDWMGSPIASNPTSVSWNGSIDTSFSSTGNWGTAPCNSLPSCSIDAIVTTSASGRQPTMTVNTQVKNLVINSGASLRIKTGVTLDVCGDFTNNGTLIAEPGSTVRFSGTINQTINGNLIGVNSFANLVIFKASGNVTLNCNTDVSQNFSTLSATSIFSINGKTMKIGGDFTNNTGNTTFTGIANSNVEFNGTINQYFTNVNGATGINMNRVKMNKPSGKLYLMGANSKLTVDSVLTLTQGIIVTRNVATLEVSVRYNASAAVIGHSALSYIDGKLRRTVYTGSPLTLPFPIDFPVGDSLNPGGYELATVTFTGGTVIPDILGYFSPWPSGPPALGPTASECMIATYDAKPLFDHGFWTFSKTNTSPFNGIYKLNMNNTNVSNNTGSGWTIVKADIAANPSLTASWTLIGQCLVASTALSTQRVNINGTNPYSVTTTIGSNIITTPFSAGQSGTTNLSVGAVITGTGIPAGSVITAILTATSFTISNNATATGTVTGSIGSTANMATSFNHLYAIAQSTVPLPIELLSFTAEPEGETVLCKWITASETNNDYFEVLRSDDGIEFKSLGIVNGFGAGTSTTNRSYKFVDNDECTSIRYYQLKQVDIDSRFSLSNVVAVNCNTKENEIKLYPNPATNDLTFSFFQNSKDEITVEYLDMLGKLIRDEHFQTVKGYNKILTSVTELANGIYYLRIKSGKGNPGQEDRQIRFVKE